MQIGYVFICNDTSFSECMRKKSFRCSSEQTDVAQDLEVNSVIFLFNAEAGILLGPFTAAEEPEDLEKGTWYPSVEKSRFSANIKLTWEKVHELRNATEKVPVLKDIKDCALSDLQTRELLRIMNEAPLYSEPKP